MNIKNTDYYKELEERIISTKQNGISNCIGSVEYFTQTQEMDKYSSTAPGRNKLDNMVSSAYPKIGGVIRWVGATGASYHAGVIVEISPKIKITHREKFRGKICVSEEIDKVEGYAFYRSENREYLIPKKLQKILTKKEFY